MAGDTYISDEFADAIDHTMSPEHILDPWTFYDFKQAFQHGGAPHSGLKIPGWVNPDHIRRLRSYQLLESYYRICARRWLLADYKTKKDRREYGDPFLMVEAILSSLLGNDQKIIVPDALKENAKQDDKDAMDALTEWADKETFPLKLSECERNSVKLGDAVYVLGWDPKKKRARLRVFDPGFYFPVWDPESDEEYPEKVHIAYEYEIEDENDKRTKWLRRITWELREVTSYDVPWEDTPAEYECFYKDQKWQLGTQKGISGELEDLSDAGSTFLQEEIGLGIDFIPVIHVPNMAPDGCWGTSALANIIQLLDDLVATDTDLQSASSLTGAPIIGVGKAKIPTDSSGNVVRYGPGDIFETGEGSLEMLDTSRSLDALLKMLESQLDRVSVNGRTPGTLLGRVDPSKVQSGIILTLSFAPHTTMIREMRRIRKVKYNLLLKFVLRFMWKEGQVKSAPKAEVQFGSYLPADKTEAGNIVNMLLTSQGISRETGINMLLEAGFPIEDIKAELDKIARTDFKGADLLVQATNDTEAAREYLNLPGKAPELTTVSDQNVQAADAKQQQAEANAQAAKDRASALAAGGGQPFGGPPQGGNQLPPGGK